MLVRSQLPPSILANEKGIFLSAWHSDDDTLLHTHFKSSYHALEADTHILRRFLASGVDINAQNNDGDTVLHIFITHWIDWALYIQTCRFLLDSGVDVNAQNNHGDTVLHTYLKISYRKIDIQSVVSSMIVELTLMHRTV